MMLWCFFWSAAIMGLANLRMQLFDLVGVLHRRVRQKVANGYLRRRETA